MAIATITDRCSDARSLHILADKDPALHWRQHIRQPSALADTSSTA